VPTSDEYRHWAQECVTLAKQTLDPIERQELMQMAAQWDKLADYKAKVERRGAS
jgi:hypothetical protein